jgi:hypothetical protein
MIWSKLQDIFLRGKVFVIGLTFVDKDGQLIEQYQTHGTVIELTNNGLLRIERQDNSIFQVPYHKKTIVKARKGEYRERTTGEIITNPDFLMTWEITVEKNENLEIMKNNGFLTGNETI